MKVQFDPSAGRAASCQNSNPAHTLKPENRNLNAVIAHTSHIRGEPTVLIRHGNIIKVENVCFRTVKPGADSPLVAHAATLNG